MAEYLTNYDIISGSVNIGSEKRITFFEEWVPEPINFGKIRLKFTLFLVQNKLEIGVGNL